MPSNRSAFRRKALGSLALSLLAAAALAGAGCDRLKHLSLAGDPAEAARKRVEFILATTKAEGHTTGTGIQTAICRFDQDKIVLNDRDQLEAAVDAFDQWRISGGFFAGIESFEIDPETRYAGEGDPKDTFYFRVKVNGSWRWLRVPPKARIGWVAQDT